MSRPNYVIETAYGTYATAATTASAAVNWIECHLAYKRGLPRTVTALRMLAADEDPPPNAEVI